MRTAAVSRRAYLRGAHLSRDRVERPDDDLLIRQGRIANYLLYSFFTLVVLLALVL